MTDYCTFRFEGGICDLPPNHNGNHIVDGEVIVFAPPSFDDYAEEFGLDEEQRAHAFDFWFKTTTGELNDRED